MLTGAALADLLESPDFEQLALHTHWMGWLRYRP
jgi:hypothetical protein